jgi:hypothetical protein
MALTAPQGISGRTRLRFCGELALPGNTEYAVILDTTRALPNNLQGAPAKSATLPTVGSLRGTALGRIYGVMISCTTQNVTLLEYFLHGDGTWHQFATTTITAGAAAQAIAVDPSAYGTTDVLVVALAGATAPDHIYVSLTERTVA